MIPPGLLACAPNISPITLEAVIRVESGGDPLAIHVNGVRTQPEPASTAAEAVQLAEGFILRGYSVDIGLMQVNSRNLAAIGTTVERMLDPCANIRTGVAVLTTDYAIAARTHPEGQPALQAALSAYNTGSFDRGFGNGYVARYYGPAGVPALTAVPSAVSGWLTKRSAPPPNPYTADTSVFAREVNHVSVE
jgi:type IV secretion system protein VirB1